MKTTLFFLGFLLPFCFANIYCAYNSNRQITQNTGVIEEPIGGGNYEDEKSCMWTVTKPQDLTASHVTFRFSRFDLEYAYDYLFITVGNFSEKWHGYMAPNDFSVPLNGDNVAVIKFLTDQLVSFTGFRLTYEFSYCASGCYNGICSSGVCSCDSGFAGVDCSQPYCLNNCNGNGICTSNRCSCFEGYRGNGCEIPPPQHCSGETTVYGASGNFSDHYPYYEPYRGSSRCNWIINTGSRYPVTVATSLHQFNWGDNLLLFDNVGNTSSYLGRLAYSGFPQAPLIGYSGELWLKFAAVDSEQQYTGFTALYSRNDLCPRSCTDKGYCIEGICHCFPLWGGFDCSVPASVNQLVPGVLTKDTINDFTWKYYQLDIPVCSQGEQFTVINTRVYNETPTGTFSSRWKWGGGYVEYYLQRSKLPTPDDYADYTVYYWAPNFVITPNLCPATYYIGVHAEEATVFSIFIPALANLPTSARTSATSPASTDMSSSHTAAKHLGTGLVAAIIVIVVSIVGFGVLGGLYIYYTKFRRANNHIFESVPMDDPDDAPQ